MFPPSLLLRRCPPCANVGGASFVGGPSDEVAGVTLADFPDGELLKCLLYVFDTVADATTKLDMRNEPLIFEVNDVALAAFEMLRHFF
jgi:hypothetical protein